VLLVLDVPTADVPPLAPTGEATSRFLDATEEVAGTWRAKILQRLADGDLDVLLGELVGRRIRIQLPEPVDHPVATGACEPEMCLFGSQFGERLSIHGVDTLSSWT